MKIIIAPDKFKGSLTALEVSQSIERGIKKYDPMITCLLHPLADGGDGSLEVLKSHLDLTPVSLPVFDPLGRQMVAQYFISEEKAFVEMASASGLVLLKKEERNPLKTSTFGTGKMIADAIQKGCREIYLFLGGSATNDGGIGIAQALGFEFLAEDGRKLAPTGEHLGRITHIKSDALIPGLKESTIYCLCDVINPLVGPNGASHVYAQQKGADPEAIAFLENGMHQFAFVIEKQFNKAIKTIPGGGAAGGIAAGLFGLLNAQIKSGIGTILELSQFEQQLKTADIVISGEGKLDNQTLEGKVINGVSNLAKAQGTPLLLFVGQNQLDAKYYERMGVAGVFSVLENAKDIDDAINNASRILEELAFEWGSSKGLSGF